MGATSAKETTEYFRCDGEPDDPIDRAARPDEYFWQRTRAPGQEWRPRGDTCEWLREKSPILIIRLTHYLFMFITPYGLAWYLCLEAYGLNLYGGPDYWGDRYKVPQYPPWFTRPIRVHSLPDAHAPPADYCAQYSAIIEAWCASSMAGEKIDWDRLRQLMQRFHKQVLPKIPIGDAIAFKWRRSADASKRPKAFVLGRVERQLMPPEKEAALAKSGARRAVQALGAIGYAADVAGIVVSYCDIWPLWHFFEK